MKKWLKRIRGALGMGLAWAATWFVLTIPTVVWWIGFPVMFAMQGFMGGVIFSTVLGIVEGRRRFDEMSLPRFAAWGAVGGLVSTWFIFAPMNVSLVGMVLITSLLTLTAAGSAAGTLALARRADDRELLDAGADVGDVGLTKQERHELLGK